MNQQVTSGRWEVYRCRDVDTSFDGGPDRACGIRAVENDKENGNEVAMMVVSDTNREECCHMMRLADAQEICLLHNEGAVITIKGDISPEQFKAFRERWMREIGASPYRALVLDSDADALRAATIAGYQQRPVTHRQECRDPECGGCGTIMGGDVDYSTSKPTKVSMEDFVARGQAAQAAVLRTDSIGTCKLCGYEGPGPKHDCRPLKTVSVMDQPPPKATTLRPCWPMVIDDVWKTVVPDGIAMTIVDAVVDDMLERDQVGRARYGVPLTADNGRDQLVDAYQEGLDQAVYTRAFLEENADHDRLLARMTVQAMRMIYTRHLQHLMIMRDIIETREVARGRE